MLEDRLYEKYRVFREPEDVTYHPVGMSAIYHRGGTALESEPGEAIEVQGFTFVLKPDTDKYAKTALMVYADLVEEDYPHLASDLREALSAY